VAVGSEVKCKEAENTRKERNDNKKAEPGREEEERG
jgi:hypothetical protein